MAVAAVTGLALASTGPARAATKHLTTTTMQVSCSPSPSSVGIVSTCVAAITANAAQQTPLSGTITFTHYGTGSFSYTSCTLMGVNYCYNSFTPTKPGTDSITAVYSGDSADAGSSASTALIVGSPAAGTWHSCLYPGSCSDQLSASTPPTVISIKGTETSTSGTNGPVTNEFGGYVVKTFTIANGVSGFSATATFTGVSAAVTPLAAGSPAAASVQIGLCIQPHSSSFDATKAQCVTQDGPKVIANSDPIQNQANGTSTSSGPTSYTLSMNASSGGSTPVLKGTYDLIAYIAGAESAGQCYRPGVGASCVMDPTALTAQGSGAVTTLTYS